MLYVSIAKPTYSIQIITEQLHKHHILCIVSKLPFPIMYCILSTGTVHTQDIVPVIMSLQCKG